jgi:hypothetical protein
MKSPEVVLDNKEIKIHQYIRDLPFDITGFKMLLASRLGIRLPRGQGFMHKAAAFVASAVHPLFLPSFFRDRQSHDKALSP